MPILPSMSWISKQLLLLLLAHPVRPLGFMQDGHNLTLPKELCCIYFSTGKAKSGLRRLYCWLVVIVVGLDSNLVSTTIIIYS